MTATGSPFDVAAVASVPWDGTVRGYVPSEPLQVDRSVQIYNGDPVAVDPITFEVVRYGLLNANLEHGQILQRLCVSPVTMLARDFQPSILTGIGDLVVMGPYLQYFSSAQSLTVKWILEHRSADTGIAPGDMFLSNDPYVGSPHQPDTVVAAPVFIGDQLFCWVANILHHSDVGGSVAGSFCVDATDIYTDPPAFPPCKIVERGKIRQDLEQVFLRQSRLPNNVEMDLHAAVSAAMVTVAKIEALMARYGAAVVGMVMARILDVGEQLFVERLRSIPDGIWTQRMYAEGAHTGDSGLYRYQLTVRKQGEELFIDNTGTDPQTGSINITYAGLVGSFLSVLAASLVPDLAGAHGGIHRRVHFDPTPGTLSCADFPAAVSPAGVFTLELMISLAGTVIAEMVATGSSELQERALGPAQPHWYGSIVAGQQPSGAPFIAVNANNMIGALPASSTTDGVDFGGHFWIPEGIASNIEEVEQLYPMLCLYRRGLRCGADGAGAYRGGRSITEAYVPWGVPGMALALYVDESFPKVTGPFGGNPSSMGRVMVRHATDFHSWFVAGRVPEDIRALDGVDEPVQHKGPMILLGEDSVFSWAGANNPGYGDPLDRDPALVAADVEAGYLDAGTATRVYGVRWGSDAMVDAVATAEERARLMQLRLDEAEPPLLACEPVQAEAEVRPVGGQLGLLVEDGRLTAWVSIAGQVRLAPVTLDFTTGCARRDRPVNEVAEEFATYRGRAGESMLLREHLCPVTGRRLATELIRVDDPPVRLMLLTGTT